AWTWNGSAVYANPSMKDVRIAFTMLVCAARAASR
ncbi:MAG: hypothetical protein RLZ48_1146, partial [Actinomycetota bacterium]